MLRTEELSELGLLRAYGAIIDELRKRGIIRTGDNPLGDYTEWLVAQKLQLSLELNSNLGYDAVDASGVRYQIKSRRSGYQLSAIRNAESTLFDYVVAVIYKSDFSIEIAIKIPHSIVMQYARYITHTNSHSLIINSAISREPSVEHITALLVTDSPTLTTAAAAVVLPENRNNREIPPHVRQDYLDRLLQTTGKTNFVLLCESILHGVTDEQTLMHLIPDTNKEVSKRSIVATARRLITEGYTQEVLTIISSSHLAPSTIDTAKRILDSL